MQLESDFIEVDVIVIIAENVLAAILRSARGDLGAVAEFDFRIRRVSDFVDQQFDQPLASDQTRDNCGR